MSETAVPTSPGEKAQDEYFPEFTFREDDEPELPDEGVMEIRYRKVRSSVDKKAKKPYSCTVEVREIISVDGKKEDVNDIPSKSYDEAGNALDKLASEKAKSKNTGSY